MKILVATDGSSHAHATLEALVQRLAWFRDKPGLTLLYVHPPVPHGAAAAWVGKTTIQRYYDDECEQVLSVASKFLDGQGVAYETKSKVGDPAHEIVSLAVAEGFDLIVMGTHGHTALANLVMGSVATKVLASSKLPVLIFK